MLVPEENMTTQQEIESILGPLMGKHSMTQESRAASPPKKPRTDAGGGSGSEKRADLVQLMARLCLRHEDALSALQLDTSFVLFVQTPTGDSTLSIVPSLFAAAAAWKKAKEERGVSAPLRSVLLQMMIEILRKRVGEIKALAPESENYKKLLALQTLDVKGCFPYLMWNQSTEKLIVDSSRPALTLDEVFGILSTISKGMEDTRTITKFHSARPLSQEVKGQILPFFLSVSLRTEPAALTHAAFMRLSGNAVLTLVAVRLRPETLKRSQLAEQISKLIPARP